MPAGQKWHDSVLPRGRENRKTQELKLSRTKEEKEIYSSNRKEQVDSKKPSASSSKDPEAHENLKRNAQQSLLVLRGSFFQTLSCPEFGEDSILTLDSDTLSGVCGGQWGMWKFPGQGLNPSHSGNPSHCSDYARSLTCWATGELLDSDTLEWVEREGLRDPNNEDTRQLTTLLCIIPHISMKTTPSTPSYFKQSIEDPGFLNRGYFKVC